MELKDRLTAVGMSQSDFAEQLGVSRAAVTHWAKGEKMSDEAEALLAELEEGPKVEVGEPYPLGSLVDTGPYYGLARVIRIDRCETFSGNHKVYWCSGAQQEEKGWTWSGPSGQIPGKFIKKRLPDPEWVESHVRKP